MIKKIILILVVFLLGCPIVFCSEVTFYSYGPGGLVAKTQGEEVSYYHKDHLGSNSLVSDSSGEVVYSSDHYPFGESYNSEGDERFTYTGKEKDSSGLYYYGARYYDAVLGRFISVDPVKDVLFSPYVYVRDNPMRYVDPSGALPEGIPVSGFNLDLPESTLIDFRTAGIEPSVQHGIAKINLQRLFEVVDLTPTIGFSIIGFKIGASFYGFASTITGPEIPEINDKECMTFGISYKNLGVGVEIANKAIIEYDTTLGERGEVLLIDTLSLHDADFDFILGAKKSLISIGVDKDELKIKLGEELKGSCSIEIEIYELNR